jgi:hypothetical protein
MYRTEALKRKGVTDFFARANLLPLLSIDSLAVEEI